METSSKMVFLLIFPLVLFSIFKIPVIVSAILFIVWLYFIFVHWKWISVDEILNYLELKKQKKENLKRLNKLETSVYENPRKLDFRKTLFKAYLDYGYNQDEIQQKEKEFIVFFKSRFTDARSELINNPKNVELQFKFKEAYKDFLAIQKDKSLDGDDEYAIKNDLDIIIRTEN